MKELKLRLLLELMKDSKRSDRELAKILGVSQATVSRTRNRLVKDGLIKEFTIIPDFAKLGYELLVITTGKYKMPRTKEFVRKGQEWMVKYPNVIFASKAQGTNADGIMISLHKSYTEYDKFVTELKSEFADSVEPTDNILISLQGFIVKPFSFSYLARKQS